MFGVQKSCSILLGKQLLYFDCRAFETSGTCDPITKPTVPQELNFQHTSVRTSCFTNYGYVNSGNA
jgi:hypothetical protein